MGVIEEGWHTVEDGTKLYTKSWKTDGPAKAKVVFVHGFSDHCNTYGVLFPTLASLQIEVFAFDQRGWGLSAPKPADRGLTGPTSRVLDDISSVLRSVIPSPVPLFLMGHSMGGGEILMYAATGPADIRQHLRGYIAESPFIAFHPASKPSPVTVFFGRLAAKVLPRRQMANVIDPKFLSRDPQVIREYVEDPLCHDTGTLEGLAGLLDRTAALETGRVKLGDSAGEGNKTRLWVAHGTQDGVCSFEGTKKWFDSTEVTDKEFKVYDGWYHKLHAEPGEDKLTFANDVADWVLAKSSSNASEARAKL